MKVTSDFAILDIKRGRKGLLKKLEKGEKFTVKIEGTIDEAWSGDDGTSIEFSVGVTNVEIQSEKD